MKNKIKSRTLCLDIGDKRIGVAVSDPLGLTAQGITVLQRKNFSSDCEAILKFLVEFRADKIIIGLPLNSDGEEGPQAKKVLFFVNGLEKCIHQKGLKTDIELLDESFSSKEAESILLQADLSRKKRRKVIDKVAAALILQNYLDSHA